MDLVLIGSTELPADYIIHVCLYNIINSSLVHVSNFIETRDKKMNQDN